MDGYKRMELELTIEQLKSTAPYLVEVSNEMSKITKSYYDGLIEQGLDKKDAIKMAVQYTLGLMGVDRK